MNLNRRSLLAGWLGLGLARGAHRGFGDVAKQAGVRFQHAAGKTPEKYLPESMGAGVAPGVSQQWRWDVHRRIAAERDRQGGLEGLGIAVKDFDGDGWPDIAIANDSWPEQLFRNNRDGTFREIATEAGLDYDKDGKTFAGMGIEFADYDTDGRPDVFIDALANSATPRLGT